MFYLFSHYYYLILLLQAFCVYHCIRKGKSQQWIWLIVFLPAIGCGIYLFTEVITKGDVQTVTTNVDAVIRPMGKVKDLEKAFEFSDNHENRMALAKAYLDNGRTDEAITLLEEGRKGIFINEPQLLMTLMEAYWAKSRFSAVCETALLLLQHSDFKKSSARLVLAAALEQEGQTAQAESHYSAFQSKYSDFQGKYEYACFLLRQNRSVEACALLESVEQEAKRMTRGEKRIHLYWIKAAATKLKEIGSTPV